MDIFDNIQHDISDATFCVTTALELLSGIEQDGTQQDQRLHDLIDRLQNVKSGLDDVHRQVAQVRTPDSH